MTLQVPTQLRKGTLPALVDMLREQNDVRFDAVVPASALSFQEGVLYVAEAAVRFVETGGGVLDAVSVPAMLAPTEVFDETISEKLGIPRAYFRTLRTSGVRVDCSGVAGWELGKDGDEDERPTMALLDANVNAWLASQGEKRYLVRAFRTDDPDEVGIARSLLSNKFAQGMDNYDALLAVLSGAKEAGLDVSELEIEADLSERNMRIRINAPQIAAYAPRLLERYRDPRTGRSGPDWPVVNAGVVVGNSETGGAAWSAAGRILFQVCKNGLTRPEDALKQVHLGGVLDDGIIRYSEDTHHKNMELIAARTRDAIATFLNVDYVNHVLDEMTEAYVKPVADAQATIERVAKRHLFSEAEAASILDCFIKGGDLTAGGVMQAVTAAAQDIADPDRAAEFEDSALAVLATAAAD